jgi:magnesium transporter
MQLTLPKDSAGKQMITKLPVVLNTTPVIQIQDRLEEFAQKTASIDYFYIINKNEKLVGVISIKEVLIAPTDSLVKEVMIKDVVSVKPEADQEKVVRLALKHNIKAVPVVDKNNKFLGIVPSDKILDIIHHEHSEDTLKSIGVIPMPEMFHSILNQGVWQSYLSRIPWLLVGLVGGVVAATIIASFERTLQENIILAAFIPLVVYISDAVGVQIQAFFVRDLAFNNKISVFNYLVKQLFTSVLIGVTCGLAIFGIVLFLWQEQFVGLVIAFSVVVAILAVTIIATLMPYIFYLFGKDPIDGSGPLGTIIQDILTVSIYFSVASVLLS